MNEEHKPMTIEERVENLEQLAVAQAQMINGLLEAMKGAGETIASHRKALAGHQAALERLVGKGSGRSGALN